MKISKTELYALCKDAIVSAGGSELMAESLTRATIDAQSKGKESLGIGHLFDYLASLREGRINGQATPEIEQSSAAIINADAQGGIPHLAFDQTFHLLVENTKKIGVTVFSQKNSYTCGALGYFTRRLADEGLVALAATNSSAHMSSHGSRTAVFGTNPLSFAVPLGEKKHSVVFDQATSQTALVNIREAAAQKIEIPEGWAIDEQGEQTTDPSAALLGSLLPFGGYKGANIALMVEMLARLSGANWSLDAGYFDSGMRGPGVGMFILAINPALFDKEYTKKVDIHIDRLRREHGMTFPGDSAPPVLNEVLEVSDVLCLRLRKEASSLINQSENFEQ